MSLPSSCAACGTATHGSGGMGSHTSHELSKPSPRSSHKLYRAQQVSNMDFNRFISQLFRFTRKRHLPFNLPNASSTTTRAWLTFWLNVCCCAVSCPVSWKGVRSQSCKGKTSLRGCSSQQTLCRWSWCALEVGSPGWPTPKRVKVSAPQYCAGSRPVQQIHSRTFPFHQQHLGGLWNASLRGCNSQCDCAVVLRCVRGSCQ